MPQPPERRLVAQRGMRSHAIVLAPTQRRARAVCQCFVLFENPIGWLGLSQPTSPQARPLRQSLSP
jgi:hypothetical protein